MGDLVVGGKNVTALLRKKYKQLKDTGWVSLVQVPSEKHMEINVQALNILVNELGYSCVYVTLVKPAGELDKYYKAAGVDTAKVYFIDAISKMYGGEKVNTNRITYASGPLDIDAITTSLREMLTTMGDGKKCVFLDSVSTVLLYNSLPRTLRFSQFLTTTLKDLGVTGVMVSIAKGQTTGKLITELSKFCDEIINITGNATVKQAQPTSG
jgi:KaiC/GvpD/RAD55 family RecA-like ATPase